MTEDIVQRITDVLDEDPSLWECPEYHIRKLRDIIKTGLVSGGLGGYHAALTRAAHYINQLTR